MCTRNVYGTVHQVQSRHVYFLVVFCFVLALCQRSFVASFAHVVVLLFLVMNMCGWWRNEVDDCVSPSMRSLLMMAACQKNDGVDWCLVR